MHAITFNEPITLILPTSPYPPLNPLLSLKKKKENPIHHACKTGWGSHVSWVGMNASRKGYPSAGASSDTRRCRCWWLRLHRWQAPRPLSYCRRSWRGPPRHLHRRRPLLRRPRHPCWKLLAEDVAQVEDLVLMKIEGLGHLAIGYGRWDIAQAHIYCWGASCLAHLWKSAHAYPKPTGIILSYMAIFDGPFPRPIKKWIL